MWKRRRPGSRAVDAAVDVDVLSAFLLDLYGLARQAPLREFQRRVLERLGEVIPFSGAWWGMTRFDRELHSSFAFRMPPDYVSYWSTIREHDVLANAALASPGVTVHLSGRQLAVNPVVTEFCRRFGTRQCLCTLVKNPTLNLATFLSLYRQSRVPEFTPAERMFKQVVMPHLWAAWTANWVSQLAAEHAHRFSGSVALAVADQHGFLHACEARFAHLLELEYPGWSGPQLPAALRAASGSGRAIGGRAVSLRMHAASGMILVEAQRRSPLDSLTAREFAVADRFGSGKSYKETAAALRVAPATVRAHLRAIYEKLDISDKAELTNLLREYSPPAGKFDA